jgi:NDP-sugar pyrophosphorylase family protein
LGERFLVLYGDSYLPIDYAAPARAFVQGGKLGLMTVFKNENRWEPSNVWFEADEIKQYDKRNLRPEMKQIDYGLGFLRPAALTHRPAATPFDLADLYQDLVREKQLAGYEVEHRFYEIGSPQGLAELDSMLRAQQLPVTP